MFDRVLNNLIIQLSNVKFSFLPGKTSAHMQHGDFPQILAVIATAENQGVGQLYFS